MTDFSLATWLHVAGALGAILTGAVLLAGRKGTRRHRRLGYGYFASMTLLLGSAAVMPASFMPLFGTRFGFFHIFLVIGVASMLLGMAALRRWRRRRDPEALRAHQIHLAYSYAGVLMAGVSQLFTNTRFQMAWFDTITGFWITFVTVNLAIYALAIWLIQTRIARGDPLRFSGRTSGDVVG